MNETLFLKLHSVAGTTHAIDVTVVFFAEVLGAVMLGVLMWRLLLNKDKLDAVRDVAAVLLTVLLAYAIADYLKYAVGSERPFAVLTDVHRLIDANFNAAFPSGHTAFVTATAVAALFFYRKMGILFLGLAVAVGVSRVIAGVHWPLDIVGGLLVGGITAGLTMWGYKEYVRRREMWEWLPWKR